MKRLIAITACGLSLSACSSMPNWMQLDLPRPAPAQTVVQFESMPPGAEAKTSLGPGCRTPCSLPVATNDFTVSFALAGYQTQTIPVRITPSETDPNSGETSTPRFVPNPVFAELVAAPPPVRRSRAAPAQQPRPAAPRPPATSMAPPPAAPAPAPSSPWSPPPSR